MPSEYPGNGEVNHSLSVDRLPARRPAEAKRQIGSAWLGYRTGVTAPISILSIPASHPYTAVVWPSEVELVGDPTTPWWPHPGLDVDYLRGLAGSIDAVHLHFGFEHRSIAELTEWCGFLRTHGIPLVITIHDLQNPHLRDQTHHDRQLAVLAEFADAVLSLTNGAALEIQRRFGRYAIVVPHPPLFPGDGLEQSEGERRLVGLDIRTRRANTLPAETLIPPLVDAVRSAQGVLEISIDDGCSEAAHVASRYAEDPAVRVCPRSTASDRSFARYLQRFESVVLPYAWGTHSGWIEVCRDVGTKVIAPRIGYYHEQWSAIDSFAVTASGPESGSLHEAVEASLLRPPAIAPSAYEKDARIRQIQARHGAVLQSIRALMMA